MNPADSLFNILRDTQRIIRQKEAAGRASDEEKALRPRVIEGMAFLAGYAPAVRP